MVESDEDLVRYVIEAYKNHHAIYKNKRGELATLKGLCLIAAIVLPLLLLLLFLIWQDFDLLRHVLERTPYVLAAPFILFCDVYFKILRERSELNRYKRILWMGGFQVFAKNAESPEPELVIAKECTKDDTLQYIERHNHKIDFDKYNRLFRIW